jgi:hypothetical protein
MKAHTHEIVHSIVGAGDGGKDSADFRFLLSFRDGLEAEMGGSLILGILDRLLQVLCGQGEGATRSSTTSQRYDQSPKTSRRPQDHGIEMCLMLKTKLGRYLK